MKCPKCGHEMIDPKKIGLLGYGKLLCPMNMPYMGCGYSIK